MQINTLTTTSKSARRYASNLYVFFRSIIGIAPAHGIIVLGLRLANKFFMIAGFAIGLKSVSGRFDSFLDASLDTALIPHLNHHLIMILVVAVLFAAALIAQYFDLSLKSLISVKYGKFVQEQQTESILDYARKNNLTSANTAQLLTEYSKRYAVFSARRLATVAELMLSIGQGAVSALVFLMIVIILSPPFGLLLLTGTAIVVMHSIRKDYSRKIAAEKEYDRQERRSKNREGLDAGKLELILQNEGSIPGKSRLLESINTRIFLRQMDARKMKNSIRLIGSAMVSLTIIALLCFLSFGGIDIKQVPWMLVFLIYFAVRNVMTDIRTLMQGVASLNQHYKTITGFLSARQGTLDWPAELKRSFENVETIEDLEA